MPHAHHRPSALTELLSTLRLREGSNTRLTQRALIDPLSPLLQKTINALKKKISSNRIPLLVQVYMQLGKSKY